MFVYAYVYVCIYIERERETALSSELGAAMLALRQGVVQVFRAPESE